MPPHVRPLGHFKNLFRKSPFRVLLPLLMIMTAIPSFGAGLSVQYEVIARTGVTSIPDGVGTFTGVGPNPAIDSDGNVMITAYGSSQAGVYTFINGQLQTVADYNTLVPGGGGATFTRFSGSSKNDIDGGRVAFLAESSSPTTVLGLYSWTTDCKRFI